LRRFYFTCKYKRGWLFMHVLDLLAWVGAAISWWGTARYIISIHRSETQPRLASWIAWATANSVCMTIAILHGAIIAAIFNGLAALGNVAVLLLCGIKRAGERPQGGTDWACLTASGACMFTILIFPHMMLADAVLAMCANVIATWPTIQHAWQRPQEEAWQLFAANGGANLLGLVSVFASAGAGLSNIAGPLISMTGNMSLVVITVGRNWLTRTVGEVEEVVEEVFEEAVEEIEVLRETLVDAGQGTVVSSPTRTRKPRLIRTY
jgi:hypothetical protein